MGEKKKKEGTDWIFFITYPPGDRNPLEGLLEYNVHVPMGIHEVRKAPGIPEIKSRVSTIQSDPRTG
jgi:hypothetical protein